MEAYCVKCKTKVYIKDEKEIVMKNNRPAISGVCVLCGTKVFKIMPKANPADNSWKKPVDLIYLDYYHRKNKEQL